MLPQRGITFCWWHPFVPILTACQEAAVPFLPQTWAGRFLWICWADDQWEWGGQPVPQKPLGSAAALWISGSEGQGFPRVRHGQDTKRSVWWGTWWPIHIVVPGSSWSWSGSIDSRSNVTGRCWGTGFPRGVKCSLDYCCYSQIDGPVIKTKTKR